MKRKRANWPNFKKRIKNGVGRLGINYKKALERDQFRCAICGSYDNIVVHHLDGNTEHNSLDNLLTVCKSCHADLHGYTLKFNSPTIEIISELRQQDKTYQEIGDYLGISRQRVHQLIIKHSKTAKKDLKKIKVAPQGSLRIKTKCFDCGKPIEVPIKAKKRFGVYLCPKCYNRRVYNFQRFITCKACGRKVDRIKENSISSVYCPECHRIWAVEKRDPNVTFRCRQCHRKFHPHRNWRNIGKPIYCSMECYIKHGVRRSINEQF
jgi:predicted metal-binding protein